MPSRKRKPWRVVLTGTDVTAESGQTSQTNAYRFADVALRGDSPAQCAEILHWEDGRWVLYERLAAEDLM